MRASEQSFLVRLFAELWRVITAALHQLLPVDNSNTSIDSYTVQVDGHEVCFNDLHPFYPCDEDNWRRLGSTFLPGVFTTEQVAAAEALCGPFANSHSWPFRADANPLLAVAERVASTVFSRSYVRHGGGDSGACGDLWAHPALPSPQVACGTATVGLPTVVAYQFCFRDTLPGRFGALSTVHADNVDWRDALQDFSPLVLNPKAATACGATADDARSRALLAVGRGECEVLAGLNVWILLEDEGRSSPLTFADVSGHVARWPERANSQLATPSAPPSHALYTCHGSGGTTLAGTRNLKHDALPQTVFRACADMRPGDAYVFATWGVNAAWHAGATRTWAPKASLGRRRSLEVRCALVG